MNQNAVNTAPLRRNGFTFKHFFIAHDRCEMKVGTDGILLGAWAPLAAKTRRILDIGTGSGLLALMLAQRSAHRARIDAVELDENAARQAGENFAASPWASALHIHQGTIQAFRAEKYDLIVSNPPYYPQGVACRTPGRDNARYTTTLGHAELLGCVSRLLNDNGLFSLILPAEEGDAFIVLAEQAGWLPLALMRVAENAARPPRRMLMTFSREVAAGALRENRLDIRGNDGEYSAAYRALTRDFYLSF